MEVKYVFGVLTAVSWAMYSVIIFELIMGWIVIQCSSSPECYFVSKLGLFISLALMFHMKVMNMIFKIRTKRLANFSSYFSPPSYTLLVSNGGCHRNRLTSHNRAVGRQIQISVAAVLSEISSVCREASQSRK